MLNDYYNELFHPPSPGQRQTKGKNEANLVYASSTVTQHLRVWSQRDLGLCSISQLLPLGQGRYSFKIMVLSVKTE